MKRRVITLLVAGALSTFGLVAGAAPASAYCIDTGIEGLECVNPCPPGPWVCPE